MCEGIWRGKNDSKKLFDGNRRKYMKKIVLLISSIFHISLVQADGTLDATFGGGFGYVTLPEGFYARGLALLQTGKIVVAGSDGLNIFHVVRYNGDGSLDTTFNGTGVGENGGPGVPFSVAAHPDGSLILVGQDQFSNYFKLAKYTSEGILDVTFGTGGIVVGPPGFAVDSAFQDDGMLVAAGNDNAGNFLVVRYDASGNIDTTFVSGPTGFAESVKIQYNGKVLAAGTDSSGNMQLVRYNSNGTLDGSFGTGGVVTGPAGVATGLVIQPDGFYVIGGYDLNANPNMLLVRYDSTGVLDSSFGVSGVVTGPSDFMANGITLQADGAIVVAGDGFSGIKLTRYDSTGTLDTSFGIGGIVTDSLGDMFNVGLQSNGYIVTVGNDPAANNYQVARYTSSPALTDTTITSSSTQTTGTVNLAGGAQNPSQVLIYLDEQIIGSTNTDSGGNDTWTFSTSITFEGLYSLRVVSIYKDGNVLVSTGDILRIY